MDKNRQARLLDDGEKEKILSRKDLITISIDFGESFDPKKEITHSEFSSFLFSLYDKYKNTVIEEFLYSIAKVQRMKSEKFKDLKEKPEVVYRISECGGCGCPSGHPDPPGHALDDACFCCT